MTESLNSLAAIYAALAETLASRWQEDLPAWFTVPGREWPVFEDLKKLAEVDPSNKLALVVEALSNLLSDSLQSRWAAYETLVFMGEKSPVWLYESMYVDGRILGTTTFQVKSLYAQVGLEVSGAELPDHAAIELEFLTYLIEQEIHDEANEQLWQKARNLFVEKHAGRWLPLAGKHLADSNDPAWQVIGQLLIAVTSKSNNIAIGHQIGLGYPTIKEIDKCTLCGFCTQVCPQKALYIREDKITTILQLEKKSCIQCKRCTQTCPEKILDMGEDYTFHDVVPLRQSVRVICPSCGAPTVSQAEFDYMAEQLGNPNWLTKCLDCRSKSAVGAY